ncbi:hypothetical protein [Chryseobacterium wanjuense]
MINGNGCFGIAKVTLIVLPPTYSNVLEDKIICIEDATTLDAVWDSQDIYGVRGLRLRPSITWL